MNTTFYDFIFKKKKDSEFGDAELANWNQQRKVFSRNDPNGYCLDGKQFLREKYLFTHKLTLASTGAGKSVVIISHLLSLTAKSNTSCIVIDPSGEIRKICEGHLSKYFKLRSLNLNDISKSEQYNPFENIASENGIQEAIQLIIEGNDDFWTLSTRSIGETMLYGLLNEQQSEFPKNLNSFYKLVNLMSVEPDTVNEFMATYLPKDKYLAYASFLSIEPKVRNSILATLKASLAKLNSNVLQYITEQDSMEIQKLRKEKTILFITCREDKASKYYGFLLNLFLNQLIEYSLEMPEKEDLNLCFFLDEFASFNLGAKSFPQILPILRRRRCAMFMYLQDINQLTENYGQSGSKIILANALSKVIFGKGASLEVSKYAESLLGTTTEEVNGSLRPMSLLPAQKLRAMKQWEFLFIYGGSHFQLMKVKPYFKSHLKRRANLSITKNN